MAEKRRTLLLPAIILLLLSGSFLYIVWRMNGLPISRLFRDRSTSASWSILEEIRSLNELESAAYEMTVVFPYDFTGGEEVNWSYLKFQYDNEPKLFLEKTDPAWHRGGRLPADWKYAEIYSLCREAGIDPGRPDYRFIVMSVSLRAGVDLDSWLAGFTAEEPEDEVPGISISVDEDGNKTLEITPPPVRITSYIVRDRDGTADGYPDVPVSPEGWRVLVHGLQPRLREKALEGGLLETAGLESRTFLAEIFTAAGYQNVIFTDE